MVPRRAASELIECFRGFPAVTVLGPRQSGKTTLVRACFPEAPYVSLEDPDLRLAAQADPRGFLDSLGPGAILDEVQRVPELLSYLQGRIDETGSPGQYVLTGSHQPLLREALAQTLAGRTALLTLWPFSADELRHYGQLAAWPELIARGFFPRVHQEQLEARRFYQAYLETYVQRDVRALTNVRDLGRFQTFLTLLAGRVGQISNLSSLSNDVGVSQPTIRSWLSVLEASFVIFELKPYFRNIRKRVVRSPKYYFTDVGLAAFLLGLHEPHLVERDPLRGHLYENLVIAEVAKGALHRGQRPELFFFRDSNGNEVDLIVQEEGRLHPVEIKSSSTFSPTFLKGLRRFNESCPDPVGPGVVLHPAPRPLRIEDVKIFDPFDQPDLWSALTNSGVADPEPRC